MNREIQLGTIKFCLADDYDEMSRTAAQVLIEQVNRKADSLLTIATGSTPEGMYRQFCRRVREEKLDIEALRFHKLDEWAALKKGDPASCDSFIRKFLIDHLHISEDRYWGVNSEAEDPEGECKRIAERLRREGPSDLCILGLGANGHLGLNEPDSFLSPYTHIIDLTEQSKSHTMLNSAESKVARGMTTGMAEILQAGQILFIVSGEHKSEQFKRFMSGKVSTELPASFLWLHPRVTCVCDRAATSLVEWEMY